ncbi:ty3-gypsy retrotransposon protein [Cucumis melo var. makuwa]|uniref:Ty3-gypsy retrotransposon protein n=1 Tax=Cucumis melo var. makuwa TaxID=1194695 RepID=A0A5D3BY67_CUCMM|nr:ty3-gypsy retrotransposon protein [Cucumis melo var. makuwa]TYK04703.1 ty3-gypsy retrotransposon protein [Cucumis melo var. makuwa]
MAPEKVVSKSSVASEAYIEPVTHSRSKGSVNTQSVLKQLMESPKVGIVIKENPLYDSSSSTSNESKRKANVVVMSVMMADVTAEAAMPEMDKKINLLMKVVEERDHKILAMREKMQTRETAMSSQTFVVKAVTKGRIWTRKPITTTINFCDFPLSLVAIGYDRELHQSRVCTTRKRSFLDG